MIRIERLHVINWQYYSCQTIELGMSNLLTGITGSGKSSLIDAMQVILLGQTGRGFFNKSAAGGKSDRTLVTYLRGKYNDNQFRRAQKAFSSYLVLEFADTLNRDNFCFGAVFDLETDDTCRYDFFRIQSAFSLSWAIRDRSALSRSDFFRFLRQQDIPHKIHRSNQEYQSDLLARCGIYDPQFFSVFKTAVAYVPLDHIEDFITQNICHVDDNVDVTKMRASVLDYQQMQQEMAEFLQCRRELEQIAEIEQGYQERLARLRDQEYFLARAGVDARQQEKAELSRQESELEARHTEMMREQDELETRFTHLGNEREAIIEKLNNDPDRRHQQELIDQIGALEKTIQERTGTGQKQCSRVVQRASAWRQALQELLSLRDAETEWSRTKIERLHFMFDQQRQRTIQTFSALPVDAFREGCLQANGLREQAIAKEGQLRQQIAQLEQALEEQKTMLSGYEQGRKQYPADLSKLKQWLEQQLAAEAGRPVEVSILADLLEISDQQWVNVIEGYLNRQRLYLLVEPQWYQKAVRLFRQYTKEHHCYAYNLIHIQSLLEEQKRQPFSVLPDSLAKLLITPHAGARAYVDFLLGRVRRVERIEEVSGRATAVTADGMLYKSFSVSRMRPELWRDRYIGADSIRQQIETCKERMEALRCQLDGILREQRFLKPLRDEEPFSKEFLEQTAAAIEALAQIPALREEQDRLDAERSRIDISYSKQLEQEKERIEQEQNAVRKRQSALDKEIGAAEDNRRRIGDQLEGTEEELSALRQDFTDKYGSWENDHPQTVLRYESVLQQKGAAEKLITDYNSARGQTQAELGRAKEKFAKQVLQFNTSHVDMALNTDIADAAWKESYRKMMAIDIAERQKGIEEAQRQAEEIFHNDFINQIKRNIDTVRREIRQLNNALEDFTFGRVHYRFKCEPTDHPEYRQYYDLITSNALDGISLENFLEQQQNQERFEPLVKTLFRLITEQGQDAAARQRIEANIERYKSFKTYLKFDLVEVDEAGLEHPLSRTMGSKSGGERQTPFYIAILASLMKAYRINQNANSLRLVVFDEAFDKIDTSRIEECVAMLQKVGFQFVIVAPNDKAPYIAPNVERTLVVTKPNDYTSLVSLYRKKLEHSDGV